MGLMSKTTMNTWIVVAHRGGARLLGQHGDDPMQVFETIDHPDGHERQSSPGSSRSGRASEPRDAARAHASKTFANALAHKLQQGRNENAYRELVIIAAPRFLGLLRNALDPATAACVRGTLDKDYAGLNDRELIQRLDEM